MNKGMRARKAWKVYQETKKLICEERLMNMQKMNVKIVEHKQQEFKSLFQQPEIKAMMNIVECDVDTNYDGNIVIIPIDFTPFTEDIGGTWKDEADENSVILLEKVLKAMRLIKVNTGGHSVSINFSQVNITPYALGKVLEKIGYENYDIDRNGWEGNYWIEYRKNVADYGNWLPSTLTLEGTAMNHFMAITTFDEED